MKPKLSNTQRSEIIRRYEAGERTMPLAREYGVAHGTIGALLRRAGVQIRMPPASFRYPAEQLETVRSLYMSGLNGPQIEEQTGIPAGVVYRALQSSGMNARNKITDEQYTEAKMRYQAGESLSSIARSFGHAHAPFAQRLRADGIAIRSLGEQRRRYSCDDAFFGSIDTPQQAYWLGFIAADGYVSNGRRQYLTVTLRGPDRMHLVALAAALGATNPVLPTNRGQATLTIHSPQLIDGLMRHSVGPKKSLSLTWPDFLHDGLLRHYLRGYSDGDGSFCTQRKTGQATFTLCGSRMFLLDCQTFLADTLGFKPTKLRTSGAIHTMHYGGNRQMARFGRLLYADAAEWLERKRAKIAHLL